MSPWTEFCVSSTKTVPNPGIKTREKDLGVLLLPGSESRHGKSKRCARPLCCNVVVLVDLAVVLAGVRQRYIQHDVRKSMSVDVWGHQKCCNFLVCQVRARSFSVAVSKCSRLNMFVMTVPLTASDGLTCRRWTAFSSPASRNAGHTRCIEFLRRPVLVATPEYPSYCSCGIAQEGQPSARQVSNCQAPVFTSSSTLTPRRFLTSPMP
jgi:hypothetical protein